MQDHEFDTETEEESTDTSSDTGEASATDKNGSGDQTSDSDDTDGVDEEGYTPAERAELEKAQTRLKDAGDKISQDGQRIKTLEEENAELKNRLSERDSEPEARDTRRTETRDDSVNRRRDADDRIRKPNIPDEVIDEMTPEQQQIFAEMWETSISAQKMALAAQEAATETSTRLSESEAENQRLKDSDEQYASYQKHYGITREQFDEITAARESGDHFTADRLLNIHSSAAQRRRERAQEMSDDSGFLPTGSPETPQPTRQKTQEQQFQEEFDAAPDDQKSKVAAKIWASVPADVAERITMPRPTDS